MARGQAQHPPAGGSIHAAVSATVGPAYPAAPLPGTERRSAGERLHLAAAGLSRAGVAPAAPPGAGRSPGCCDRALGDVGILLPAVGKEHARAIAVTAEQRGTDRSVRCGGDILEPCAHTAVAVMWGWN